MYIVLSNWAFFYFINKLCVIVYVYGSIGQELDFKNVTYTSANTLIGAYLLVRGT